MSRASWGKAKLVALSLSSDIQRLHSEGLNLEEIFHELRACGKLSIGKSTFKRHAATIIASPSDPQPTMPSALTVAQSPSDKLSPSKNEGALTKAKQTPPDPTVQAGDFMRSTHKPSTSSKSKIFKHDPTATDDDLW